MLPRGFSATPLACGVMFAAALFACTGHIGGGDDGALPSRDSNPTPSMVEGVGHRLRRLSAREYVHVVRDLLGETLDELSFVDEASVSGFHNGPVNLTVQGDQAHLYAELAGDLADRVASQKPERLLGTCNVAAQGSAACRAAFYDGFVRRAFRRPATPQERAELDALFDQGEASGGFTMGLTVALEAVLMWPAFLYREELGVPDGAGRVRLTAYELASALSFFLTGTLPDEALLAAAASGRLETPEDARREARRLLAEPNAKVQLRDLIHQWLAVDYPERLYKSAAIVPAFDKLQGAIDGDLAGTVDKALWEGDGSLAALFGGSSAFVDEPLAKLYGVPFSGEPGSTKRVLLDAKTRRGILTRIGFLAAHSTYDGSSPVARGVFVRSALLCAPPPPPPPQVGSLPPLPAGSDQTTREQLAQHDRDPLCQGCHASIDGIGFAFESFDAAGVHRTSENGKPIDDSGELVGIDRGGKFHGVGELQDLLVAGDALPRCFVRQVFRAAAGATEGPDDEELLGELTSRFTTRGKVVDLFVDMITSPRFRVRNVAKEGTR